MLNYLWGFMMLAGLFWAAVHGNLNQVTEGALQSAGEAVTLSITMLGIMSFWCGMMEVGRRAGLIERLSQALRPVMKFLFPHIPKGHQALSYISTNMIANFLGLGWAATPAGLRAMEELEQLECERRKASGLSIKPVPEGTASNEMCTFLILNISSLQLIPVNVIAYRSQYGSANPTAVVGPAIAATAVSTAVAVIYCKWMEKNRKKTLQQQD